MINKKTEIFLEQLIIILNFKNKNLSCERTIDKLKEIIKILAKQNIQNFFCVEQRKLFLEMRNSYNSYIAKHQEIFTKLSVTRPRIINYLNFVTSEHYLNPNYEEEKNYAPEETPKSKLLTKTTNTANISGKKEYPKKIKRSNNQWQTAKKLPLTNHDSKSIVELKHTILKEAIDKILCSYNLSSYNIDSITATLAIKLSLHHKIPKSIFKNLANSTTDGEYKDYFEINEDDAKKPEYSQEYRYIMSLMIKPQNLFIGPSIDNRCDDVGNSPDYCLKLNQENKRRYSINSEKIAKLFVVNPSIEQTNNSKNYLEELLVKNTSAKWLSDIRQSFRIQPKNNGHQNNIPKHCTQELSAFINKSSETNEYDKAKNPFWKICSSYINWELKFVLPVNIDGKKTLNPYFRKSEDPKTGMSSIEYLFFHTWLDFNTKNYESENKDIYLIFSEVFKDIYTTAKRVNRKLFDPGLLGMERNNPLLMPKANPLKNSAIIAAQKKNEAELNSMEISAGLGK